ncbi:MAG: efflux RND transporter permease subunit [Pirellulales bacterium]|nr:efflux RND transporter permease subunit [Pirellulales bacterium]
MTSTEAKTPLMTRLVEVFLRGDVTIMLIVVSLILGLASLWLTPREEEPQIVVPLADVMVSAPGLSSEEIEQQVTSRLEKLLYQIDGVEYVYSMSKPGQCIVTVRFYVGEDREDSLVKLYNKVQSNVDRIPPAVTGWVVKPVEVDDVPIVNLTLWSETKRYDDHHLRRLAEQLQNELQAIENTNRVTVIGGRPRTIRVELDPVRLAGRHTSALQVAQALRASNVTLRAGKYEQQDKEYVVEAGTFIRDAQELGDLVIQLWGDRPVYLKDVATVIDGPAEADSYSWIGFGPAAENPRDAKDRPIEANEDDKEEGEDIAKAAPLEPGQLFPAVHIAVAKRKGTNAVWVAEAVDARMSELAPKFLPDGVFYRITRDYGETANAKVNELVEGLAIAVLTVIGLIGMMIGWRAALVVALAIPVCYSITLFINLMVGYTINRVTLFALILSLGLLVDDPITDVENIARYFAMKILPPRDAVLRAIQEVRPALILSTLAIIVSFLPLMFITGMMGPYMAPMALCVPLTVTASMGVAFMITPWLALVALRRLHEKGGDEEPAFDLTARPLYRFTKAMLGPILDRRWLSWATLGAVMLLLVGAMLLPALRVVPLKMLPYDNKNEFQVLVDMPEGTTLEDTEAVTESIGRYLAGVNEVRDYQLYAGVPSAMDFNGMVRHYFLRRGSNLAEIRVNLASKEHRSQQSHGLILRIRNDLQALADAAGAKIKLVEVPPGPPVIATITAEIYGPDDAKYDDLIAASRTVAARMDREPGLVDVDVSGEDDQTRYTLVTDKHKAALSGVSTQDVAQTQQLALSGLTVTTIHPPGEVNPLPIELRLPREMRSAIEDLKQIYLVGQAGQLVKTEPLVELETGVDGKTIYHKNLRRVAYAFAEIAGRPPADAILDMQWDREPDGTAVQPAASPRPVESRTWLNPGGGDPWALPVGYTVDWAGEGEWKITLDVFRDLGLAFAAAQVGIFILLMFQTGSRLLPIVIMLAIPLTLIGILPGFWLLNALVNRPVGGFPNPVFLTATAMIGMIGLSGIVVRNSLVLIDFFHHGLAEGLSLREAILRSVAVRTRPILATSGTTLLGNWVITLDPIFSGLAWAIIFGIFASTAFTLVVIPVVYWLLYRKKHEAAA